ncbi:molecular chaperone [Metamycoplasma arthritidis]|uniref:Gcp-like domain-containing protein n=1 Tax=Metamycoplasma arthritidis (strain 158L3-1) TaxID=243272 RepID=B3PND7_META1|nr:tRNA (adenosine(37)-N6)-threonylcarbamoyltransferase complex dimerization subunit type 1 TsaB [Metamycoplasma arthritidis]ACF07539.1 hypothetical protein MARTH_orf805 [Metamycoplasma arthritidis 158L3-1]VEU79047.1 molecular chaperone [Metamycoplasma arthritidis]
MKLFLETSLEDLYLALIDKNNKIVKSIHIPSLVKKTDALFCEINNLFDNTNYSIHNIKAIYVTLGPGSFSGARIGLLFARTIAQVTNVKMFVTYTYELFKKQLQLSKKWENLVLIKANKHSQYKIDFHQDEITTTLIENNNNYHAFDYKQFEAKTVLYLATFKEVKNPMEIELAYLHNPQIGGLK